MVEAPRRSVGSCSFLYVLPVEPDFRFILVVVVVMQLWHSCALRGCDSDLHCAFVAPLVLRSVVLVHVAGGTGLFICSVLVAIQWLPLSQLGDLCCEYH
jgi:hypothetical protein